MGGWAWKGREGEEPAHTAQEQVVASMNWVRQTKSRTSWGGFCFFSSKCFYSYKIKIKIESSSESTSPLDHFTLGQVQFEMSFGHLPGDTRQLRYINLEIRIHITIWNLGS